MQCGADMSLTAMPYLVGDVGKVFADENGVVHGARDTGMKVNSWLCPNGHVTLPAGTTPYWPELGRRGRAELQ